MTAFAPLVACSFDTDVEPRIAAGATGLAMAGLTDGQVRFGIRAMIGSQEITFIEGMRYSLGPIGVAALSIKTGRIAAGRCLVAL